MTKTPTAPKLQKLRVNFKWAKIERGCYEVFAADEEQAVAIAQEIYRELYTSDCRILEFMTVETVTRK
jgi:hypothetical protein